MCTENPIRVADVMERLSWRNDRAVLFRSDRPGVTVQVEVTARSGERGASTPVECVEAQLVERKAS